MKSFRGVRRRDAGSKLKDHELCNGPSKLCQALDIEKANNYNHMNINTLCSKAKKYV